LPALVLIDAVSRLVPGVVGDAESVAVESFSGGLLYHPQYTRPAVWRGQEVPPVLLSGHHAEIDRWRREQRQARTLERRPDLLTADNAGASEWSERRSASGTKQARRGAGAPADKEKSDEGD